jgi:hypothetical protein
VTGFTVRSEITDIEVIAVGKAVRDRRKLDKAYGRGRWRKLKGVALVELPDRSVHQAELHWYEAHGIGRRDMKVKRLIE